MFLSDLDILWEIEQGNITCEPFVRANLSNSSLDLRLGRYIARQDSHRVIKFDCDENGKLKILNPIEPIIWDLDRKTGRNYILAPGDFVLAQTLEFVGQDSNLIISQVADKSTLARLGLSVCFSAGYIDAGNVLNITLELKNNGNSPIELQEGMQICQLKFAYLSSEASEKYQGKYQGSRGVEIAH